MQTNEKTIENRLRRKLSTMGYLLRKSRVGESVDNFGGYMIVDANYNAVVAGARYDLSLDDVEQFVNE